jgi:hypothetical protein
MGLATVRRPEVKVNRRAEQIVKDLSKNLGVELRS